MKINYNVAGPKRKLLVAAISQELNTSTKYLGAPTFAYEVGGYHIDKNGILEGEDNPGLVADLQGLHDFKAITEEYDTPLPEGEPVPEDVQIPYEAALGGRVSLYSDYEEPPEYEEPEQIDEVETNRLTIDLPSSAFTDAALENLKRLVESKSSLIKKALGTDYIPIITTEETISFPWFQGELTSDEVKAYTHFVTALCETAKTQQRVNATEKQVENEKYAFRCFLVRLGFVGSEYKAERKILLKNLSGNSAFKNGAPTRTEEVMTDE
ncbi:MAG: virulence protein [Oscillospiraceae bacterium]|nr:virulence protein [Oscillospiraceae bacterium]